MHRAGVAKGVRSHTAQTYTVNVEIFAQYIFSRILCRVLDARKYDVSEKINHYRTDRVNCAMRENLSSRKCRLGLDA